MTTEEVDIPIEELLTTYISRSGRRIEMLKLSANQCPDCLHILKVFFKPGVKKFATMEIHNHTKDENAKHK